VCLRGQNITGDSMRKWIKNEMEKITQPVSSDSAPVPVSRSLEKNIVYFKEKLGSSFDIMYKQTQIGGNKAMFIMDDGMCDNLLVTGQQSDFNGARFAGKRRGANGVYPRLCLERD
jgi:hypothetical protein